MASIQPAYGPSGQAFTVTLTSLASASAQESTAVNFTAATNGPFADVLVMLTVKFQAGTLADEQAVTVYAYGSVDGGTTYPDAVTGSDAAITLQNPTQLARIGTLRGASNTSVSAGPWSFRAPFGGTMPAIGGIVVENRSGIALTSTASDHVAQYQGVYDSVA
jgi:hypothetical protein